MTNNDEGPAGRSGGGRAAADALQTANGRGAQTTHHEVPPRADNKAEEAADALFDSLPVDNGVQGWPRYVSRAKVAGLARSVAADADHAATTRCAHIMDGYLMRVADGTLSSADFVDAVADWVTSSLSTAPSA